MTATRPTPPRAPPQEAAAELRRSAGSHLDPAVVDALLAVLGLGDESLRTLPDASAVAASGCPANPGSDPASAAVTLSLRIRREPQRLGPLPTPRRGAARRHGTRSGDSP